MTKTDSLLGPGLIWRVEHELGHESVELTGVEVEAVVPSWVHLGAPSLNKSQVVLDVLLNNAICIIQGEEGGFVRLELVESVSNVVVFLRAWCKVKWKVDISSLLQSDKLMPSAMGVRVHGSVENPGKNSAAGEAGFKVMSVVDSVPDVKGSSNEA